MKQPTHDIARILLRLLTSPAVGVMALMSCSQGATSSDSMSDLTPTECRDYLASLDDECPSQSMTFMELSWVCESPCGASCVVDGECDQGQINACLADDCFHGGSGAGAPSGAGSSTGHGGGSSAGPTGAGGSGGTGGSSGTGGRELCGSTDHHPRCVEYTQHECAKCDAGDCSEEQICYAVGICDEDYDACPQYFECVISASSCDAIQACEPCQG